ncbi:MAG TPA: peptide-methionine (S)-S-oxide reductase MsrA [Pseudomonadaceae bacterium]|nr:peptide-methionine (S)-S-oxide reductase MsrA [Pseudomonadaceae bacterium]
MNYKAVSSHVSGLTREQALPDRAQRSSRELSHLVLDRPLQPPWPAGSEVVLFGMGCFWGAERLFWQQPGVWTTAVGYSGGYTAHPSYEDVCSGMTAHAEVVLVVYDPQLLSFERLLQLFWESHDPTQGMRQGNDRGSQYRSAIYTSNTVQQAAAEASMERYGKALAERGKAMVTTEIRPAGAFYLAEEAHQQYLARNPFGYCGLQGTGVPCPGSESVGE